MQPKENIVRLELQAARTAVVGIALPAPHASASRSASLTTSRPVRVYLYATSSPDVQARLTELGITLTENGANVWIMIPGN